MANCRARNIGWRSTISWRLSACARRSGGAWNQTPEVNGQRHFPVGLELA